jgi:hypothetical protein
MIAGSDPLVDGRCSPESSPGIARPLKQQHDDRCAFVHLSWLAAGCDQSLESCTGERGRRWKERCARVRHVVPVTIPVKCVFSHKPNLKPLVALLEV